MFAQSVAQRKEFFMKTDKLIFGAAYYSEYLPYERIDKDMEMMVRAGMNTIRIAESTWSTLEPADNVYDFSHLDLMLKKAKEYRLSVIVGTPTYAVPAWLVKKHPDVLPITHNGQALYGHRQNMDITNSHYLFHAERIIRTLMEHVKDEPHVIGFQLDNETKAYDTCSESAQRKFVEYLKNRYEDIDEFNKDFGLDYWSNRINCWEEFPDIRGTINQSLDAEYKKFQRKLVTDFLTWQSDIVKEYRRPDQFITHNFDYQWINYSFGYHPEVNQYEAVKCMDVAGCDIYHPTQDNLTGAEITCDGNITRSLVKDSNYLILETQGQGNTQWLPYKKQLRLAAFSHIANGANSVMYWHWHSIHNSFESYWKGLLSHDFSENSVYKEACDIGNTFKRIGTHLVNIKKTNKVSILLDNNSLTGLSEFPLETTGDLSYNTVMRWLADSLFRLNIEYDMVSSGERDFSSYDYLIIPALYSASEDLLTAISDYVQKGGKLIATFKTGFADEHLKIYSDTQPHILNKCLGITYDQFTYPNCSIRCDNGTLAKAREWMELVSCTTAKSLAVYDHYAWEDYSAITLNTFGKGKALYLSTMFDEQLLDNVLSDFITDIWRTSISSPVIIKRGTNDAGHMLWYYFNYSKDEKTIEYEGNKGTELISDIHIDENVRLTIAPWDFLIIEEQ